MVPFRALPRNANFIQAAAQNSKVWAGLGIGMPYAWTP